LSIAVFITLGLVPVLYAIAVRLKWICGAVPFLLRSRLLQMAATEV